MTSLDTVIKHPIRIVITGAAGQIAYLLMHPLCNGDIFGKDQSIILHLHNTTRRMTSLQGLVMEIEDSNYPLVKDIISTDKEDIAFKDVDVAIFLGSVPSTNAIHRKELLDENVKIFQSQGKALDIFAKKTVKVLVVSNPANTNCYILAHNAPSIPRENFTCLTCLDYNRARNQIAYRLKLLPNAIKNIIIWGNHSMTVFPDVRFATVTIDGRVISVYRAIQNDDWLRNDFVSIVRERGSDIMAARKLKSSVSAAKAIIDHMQIWWHGTNENEWVSMGIISDGSYGIEKGLAFSYPVQIKNGRISIVRNLELDDWSKEMINKTHKELIEEKNEALRIINLDNDRNPKSKI